MPDETPARVPVLGISIEGKFNQSRSIVFQLHVPFDADEKTIYKEFSKACDIMDRREEFYLLKGLRITMEREEAKLKTEIEKLHNTETQYQNEWNTQERRGPFKLGGQQKANIDNARGAIANIKEFIATVKAQIAELEELQKAYE